MGLMGHMRNLSSIRDSAAADAKEGYNNPIMAGVEAAEKRSACVITC